MNTPIEILTIRRPWTEDPFIGDIGSNQEQSSRSRSIWEDFDDFDALPVEVLAPLRRGEIRVPGLSTSQGGRGWGRSRCYGVMSGEG